MLGAQDQKLRICGFHAYKSVAPLKRVQRLPDVGIEAGFHAYKSVAPLKQPCIVGKPDDQAEFPRLQKRGPIEADGKGAFGAPVASFHAYKSVAPLKLAGVYGEWRRDAAFPRLQKRGHIEGAHRDAPVHRDAPSAHRGDAPSAHVFTPTKAWPY